MQNEQGPAAGTGETVSPKNEAHSNSSLSRVAVKLMQRMAKLESRVAALEDENMRLKRRVHESYDWSAEVAR